MRDFRDDLMPFGGQSIQVRLAPTWPSFKVGYKSLSIPAKLALNSEEKEREVKLPSKGPLAYLGNEQMSFIKDQV